MGDYLSTLDDDALVTRAVCDPDAFAALYRRHLHRVYSYLVAKVGNVHDAEDLTAQTFIAALEDLPQYESRGKFAAWLLSIARHKALNHLRGDGRFAPLEVVESWPHAAPLPEETVEQRQAMDEVASTLQTLSSDRAEALVLRIFGELSLAEVAAVMGRSEAACKMLVHRALQDLRQRLLKEQNNHE